jgi:hypothetical protein
VNISHNGGGTVEPQTTTSLNFSFTYTPSSSDAGKVISIFVTTDNPQGSPCAAADETFELTVNPVPSVPTVGTITSPTCTVSTGSVALSGLPSNGTWTLNRSPGNSTTGTGTSTLISTLQSGTYLFNVTAATGCTSGNTPEVVIEDPPDLPDPPQIENIIPPTCTRSTGSVDLSGLPSTGTWTLTRVQGGVTTPGSGTQRTVQNLLEGTYNFTVTNADGCTSGPSADVVMPAQPQIPNPPVIGAITHPTCEIATGSVVLNQLPEEGTWTLTRFPGTIINTGTGNTTLISDLVSGTYNFIVSNESGCTSIPSNNVVVNNRPPIPSVPVILEVIQPTCIVLTGSIRLGGLPSGQEWILTQNPGNIQFTGNTPDFTLTGL